MTSSQNPAPGHHHGHHNNHDHEHGHHHGHSSFLPQLLNLDARVQSGLLNEAADIVAALPTNPDEVRRVLDIGAGTGAGTEVLAHRFPAAEIVAVDINEQMLEHVRERAASASLTDRVRTVQADVADALPDLGAADVVWSVAALHEVRDPARALANLFDVLRPGGWLAVMEMADTPRVLPAAYADFEERLHTAATPTAATHHPEWTPAISAAGFVPQPTRRLSTDLVLPAAGDGGEFAALELRRIAHSAMANLEEADQTTLRELIGEGAGSVRTLGEVWIRANRTLWTAQRP